MHLLFLTLLLPAQKTNVAILIKPKHQILCKKCDFFSFSSKKQQTKWLNNLLMHIAHTIGVYGIICSRKLLATSNFSCGKWKMVMNKKRNKLNDMLLNFRIVGWLRFISFFHLISASVVVLVIFICYLLLQFTFRGCNDANCHDKFTCIYAYIQQIPIRVDLPAEYVSNLYAHIVIPKCQY